MGLRRLAPALTSLVVLVSACALENISTGTGKSAGTDAGAAAADGGDAAPAVQGAGCGVEAESGLQLCAATSACPTLAVDTNVFPSCGFRIQGSVVDLVCGCDGSICSMGAYTTCAQASALLEAQTQQQVCMQVAEGRCAAASRPSSPSSGSTCNRACLSECGGGAGCASLCGC